MPPASSRNAFPATECLIVGGGPSGLLAGLLLAEWGRSVCVVDDGAQRSEVLPETVAGADIPTLKRLGILPILKAQNPIRPLIAIDQRCGDTTETEFSRNDAPLGLDYLQFLSDLRRFVAGRGVELIHDVHVRGPIPSGADAWIPMVDSDGGRLNIQAGLVILAQGQSSVFTTTQLSIDASLPESVAISLVTKSTDRSIDREVTTTSARGIFRSKPTVDGGLQETLTADRSELDKLGHAAMWSEAAGDSSAVLARKAYCIEDATLRLVSTRDDMIMFGSAAVRQAASGGGTLTSDLRSAEAAALAANTILSRPSEAADIIDHHRVWERERFLALARDELKWCAKETQFGEAPFWLSRMERIERPVTRRTSPHRVVAASNVEQRQSYARKGSQLRFSPSFALRGSPDAITSIAGVPIAELLRLIKDPQTLDEVVRKAATTPTLKMIATERIKTTVAELLRLGFAEGA